MTASHVLAGLPRSSIRLGLAAAVLAVAVLAAPITGASAQEVRVGLSKSWTTHDLLQDPTGLALGFGFPIRDRFSVRLGYEWSGDDFRSTGSTCSGLVPPDEDCAPETREDRGRMNTFTVSVPVLVYGGDRVAADLIPMGHVVTVSSVQTGQRTGRTRSADASMVGFGIGGEVRVRVTDRWPVYMRLLGRMAWLDPWQPEFVVDGYTPFNTGVRLSKLEAGVAVALR